MMSALPTGTNRKRTITDEDYATSKKRDVLRQSVSSAPSLHDLPEDLLMSVFSFLCETKQRSRKTFASSYSPVDGTVELEKVQDLFDSCATVSKKCYSICKLYASRAHLCLRLNTETTTVANVAWLVKTQIRIRALFLEDEIDKLVLYLAKCIIDAPSTDISDLAHFCFQPEEFVPITKEDDECNGRAVKKFAELRHLFTPNLEVGLFEVVDAPMMWLYDQLTNVVASNADLENIQLDHRKTIGALNPHSHSACPMGKNARAIETAELYFPLKVQREDKTFAELLRCALCNAPNLKKLQLSFVGRKHIEDDWDVEGEEEFSVDVCSKSLEDLSLLHTHMSSISTLICPALEKLNLQARNIDFIPLLKNCASTLVHLNLCVCKDRRYDGEPLIASDAEAFFRDLCDTVYEMPRLVKFTLSHNLTSEELPTTFDFAKELSKPSIDLCVDRLL